MYSHTILVHHELTWPDFLSERQRAEILNFQMAVAVWFFSCSLLSNVQLLLNPIFPLTGRLRVFEMQTHPRHLPMSAGRILFFHGYSGKYRPWNTQKEAGAMVSLRLLHMFQRWESYICKKPSQALVWPGRSLEKALGCSADRPGTETVAEGYLPQHS